jgi:hypothetical protein
MGMIVETQYGFDCIVGGKRFGTWRSHKEAKAGMVTEEIRLQRKQQKTPDMNHHCRGVGCRYPTCENNLITK